LSYPGRGSYHLPVMPATSPPLEVATSVAFARDLARYGDQLALVEGDRRLTFAELADRVDRTADELGATRRLVMVETANAIEAVVAYLGALRGGHPVLLVGENDRDQIGNLVDTYDPDVTFSAGAGWALEARRDATIHTLHPDLALLMATSGSTGSSKLVRLSRHNIEANAASIAEYLELTAADRAITTLPMHYCYGLSVINSHLAVGGGVVLSNESVTEPAFWCRLRAERATSFAGVPYTFDLLDRIDFAAMSLPSLRYITQAGGRLEPERVRRYAELGRRHGWQLFVMYGQTEATARMAYLPPALAEQYPSSIGCPIPGGSFTIEPFDDDHRGDHRDGGVGELVYRGPNVMLGYAHGPLDLGLGRTVESLRTGDVARCNAAGLYELAGRRSRFVKLFGVRTDLDQLERHLAAHDIRALCTGDDTRLVVAVEGLDVENVQAMVADRCALPTRVVRVVQADRLPRLANGKPDYAQITRLDRTQADPPADPAPRRTINQVFADVLGERRVDDGASFVGLGGDSLSYVALSVELEEALGDLPPDWQNMPVRDLEQRRQVMRTPGRSRFRSIETNVVLRAVAIVLVVGTHAGLFRLQGGAHLLLAIAGFNFARFALSPSQVDSAPRRLLESAARIAIPSAGWICLLLLTTSELHPSNALLVHGVVGGTDWDERWRYWYIEALVQMLVVLAVILSVRGIRRLERSHGFVFALAAVAVGLAFRFDVGGLGDVSHPIYRPQTIFWVFALGWLAERASSNAQRLVVVALVLLAVPGHFEEASRESVIVLGLAALVWLPTVKVPWPLNRVGGQIAAASLYIYLTNAAVYPPLLTRSTPFVATLGAVAVGVSVSVLLRRAPAIPRPAEWFAWERPRREGLREATVASR
jgi:acyl-CoA synthetase (AMP-forming)/AMP-acid ligase II